MVLTVPLWYYVSNQGFESGIQPSTSHVSRSVQRRESAVYNAVAMNLSKTARLLLALASGVALALAFPFFNLPILGWIAPAMLIVAVLSETPGFALLLGWLQGAVFYALSVPWFYTVMRQYGPLPVMPRREPFTRWWSLYRRHFTPRSPSELPGFRVRVPRALV